MGFAENMSEFGQVEEVTFQSFRVGIDVSHLTLQSLHNYLSANTTSIKQCYIVIQWITSDI